jgi:hypothetical protein
LPWTASRSFWEGKRPAASAAVTTVVTTDFIVEIL